MKWVEANGAVLRCELAGSEGSTVVLLHEAGGSLESWDAVAAALLPRCRVLRYDQRGFGMSESTRELGIPQMVRDLVDLLDALGIAQRCHLAGTAVGGSIALATAALYPDRVASVLATSPVTGGLPEAAHASLRARAATVEADGMRPVADASLWRSWPPELRADLAQFEQYRARYLANDPLSFAALTRSFLKIELQHLYAHIQCPALVVGCRHDGVKPARECAEAAARMPLGRYAELDTGHFAAVQAPQAFAALLLEFLESTHAPA